MKQKFNKQWKRLQTRRSVIIFICCIFLFCSRLEILFQVLSVGYRCELNQCMYGKHLLRLAVSLPEKQNPEEKDLKPELRPVTGVLFMI